MPIARWAVLTAALALAGCGGQKHIPLQPLSAADEGRFYIRSVTVVSNESEADFDNAFRRQLNKAANVQQPTGEPVDLFVTVKSFRDANLADEIFYSNPLGGTSDSRGVSSATVEIALRDPANRNRPIYRDVQSVQDGSFGGVVTGHPIALALSLAVTAVASAATNEAESMAEDLADVTIDDLIDTGRVLLPEGAAFALPPRAQDESRVASVDDDVDAFAIDDGADAFAADDDANAFVLDDAESEAAGDIAFDEAQDDFAFAVAVQADPIEIAPTEVSPPPANDDALALGVYDSQSAADDEAERIARFSGDLAPASSLTVQPSGDGYALVAIGLRPSAQRMLCARRKIENKACGG